VIGSGSLLMSGSSQKNEKEKKGWEGMSILYFEILFILHCLSLVCANLTCGNQVEAHQPQMQWTYFFELVTIHPRCCEGGVCGNTGVMNW